MKPTIAILFALILFASCSQQKSLSSAHNFSDTDLDGVHDNRDACPNEAGSVFNLGCPENESKLSLVFNEEKSTDSDLDGVPDVKDDCPTVYGSPFNQGCPFENSYFN